MSEHHRYTCPACLQVLARHATRVFLLFGIVALPSSILAQTVTAEGREVIFSESKATEPTIKEADTTEWTPKHGKETDELNVEDSIDNAHKGASDMLHDFASQLDNYFGEEISTTVVNNTKATLRLDLTDPVDGDFETTAKFKLRLVLPRSQQRMRLLLDVDEEDEDSSSAIDTLPDDELDRAFSFAFRFIRNISDRTRFNVDVGARRFEQRFQTFARLRVSTKYNNEEGWSHNINNDLRQYYSSGYANRTSFNFWHNIDQNPSLLFRASTSFNWQKNSSGVQIDQSVGIYKSLRQRSLLAFEVLAGYNTSPDNGANHYGGHTARIRYRKSIFRPWFHYEIWPSVSWFTEDNSGPKFGGLIRTEVQFGKYKM